MAHARIQNAVTVVIAISIAIWKNHFNAKIMFHIAEKMWFGQLKNLSNKVVLSEINDILNPLSHVNVYTSHVTS